MKAGSRIFGLDLMRALAILFVVVAHSQRQIQVVFPDFRPYTKVDGVTLFFVLSGFLIGRIIFRTIEGRNFRSLVRFYNRRWWRTLPNYYFFFALHIVFYYVFSIQENIDWRGLLFLQNINSPPEGFFRESWSLAVEEWFYLVFPFIWWLLHKKEVKPKLRTYLTYTLGMLLLAWAYKAWFFASHSIPEGSACTNCRNYLEIYVRLPVVFRFSSILWGVLLSIVFMYKRMWFDRGWPWFISAVLVWVLGEWAFHQIDPVTKTIWKLEFKSLLAALFIAAAYSLPHPNIRLSNVVNRISVYSYSIYLINLPFLAIWRWLILDKLQIESAFGVLMSLPLAWLLIYALASVTYHKLEKPLTQLRMNESS